MKIKTIELVGKPLDWAVAKCKGEKYQTETEYDGIGIEYPSTRYSTNWAQGGQIIEKEGLLFRGVYGEPETINSYFYHTGTEGCNASGPTHLIAAMRCYVASKLGDEIEVPDELVT